MYRRAEKIQKKAKLVRTISMIDESALPVPEGKIKPAKSVEKLIEKEKQGQGKVRYRCTEIVKYY
jgi:hypothetical protein